MIKVIHISEVVQKWCIKSNMDNNDFGELGENLLCMKTTILVLSHMFEQRYTNNDTDNKMASE